MKNGNKRIMIVEDEFIFARYLEVLLKHEGYTVVDMVDNGEEAVRQSSLLKPDLVLIDNILRGKMSGCEAAVAIHQQQKDIKIIFLTAYIDEEMINYAMRTDVMAYLMKPYRENEILTTIKLLFSHDKILSQTKNSENISLRNGYVFNTKYHRLFKENHEIPLGKKTLKLIEVLVNNRNVSVSNEQICNYIWGEPKSDCTLRSLIHRIREMVGYDIIENINGLGYKIKAFT